VLKFIKKYFKRKTMDQILRVGIGSNIKLEEAFINGNPENRHIDKFGRPWKRINGEWIEGC